MSLLSLDISSKNTGWAIVDQQCTDWGDFAPTGESHGEKLNSFKTNLENLIVKFKPTMLIIEDVWGGKNIRVLKTLSYYHGVCYQVANQNNVSVKLLMPSQFRRILGNKHGIKLNMQDREEAKAAMSAFIWAQIPASTGCSEDTSDAIGIGLAGQEWNKQFAAAVEQVKIEKPKTKSISKIIELADKKTQEFFDKQAKEIGKANARSVESSGSRQKRKRTGDKESLQDIGSEVSS